MSQLTNSRNLLGIDARSLDNSHRLFTGNPDTFRFGADLGQFPTDSLQHGGFSSLGSLLPTSRGNRSTFDVQTHLYFDSFLLSGFFHVHVPGVFAPLFLSGLGGKIVSSSVHFEFGRLLIS